MSSRTRLLCRWAVGLILLSICALALNGCGFKPVYGSRSSTGEKPVARALAGITIPPIAERNGQILHNYLVSDITPRGAPAAPTHRLEVYLIESESTRGLDEDAFTQRASLRMVANFDLIDIASENQALRGSEEMIVGFNLENRIDNVYSTIVARENARKQALRAISRQIATRLAIFASSNLEPLPR